MRILIIISMLFLTIFSKSQTIQICGTDRVMKQHRKTDFFKKNQLELKNNNLFTSVQNTKIIPLVFHIIHDGHPIGEEENISLDQIYDAVSILNEDFNNLNEDLDNVINEFQPIVGNPNIEFRIAKLDPNGNCTNGINRVFSEETNQANDCVKELISWDDTKYVNIWVVEDIDLEIGAAAYTYLPGSLWGDEVEGIIINHEYLGSIGTSNNSPYQRHTLTHEFGHFFNLEHTWGWGSNGELDNCSDDDGVIDTPNTIGTYSMCNLSQESCGSLDNIQNFMDYSSCSCMFTNDQVTRMDNCLNSSISSRNNLWANTNLWITGTHNNYNAEACSPSPDFFISNPNRICLGVPITFNNSTNNLGDAPVFYWTFQGADISYSSEQNPTVTFTQSGEHQVSLNVVNNGGENTITKEYIVYNSSSTLNEDFQNTQFPTFSNPNLSWSIVSPENETTWARTPISASSTTGSVRIRSRYFDCYRQHFLYTPNLDLTNYALGTGEPLKIWFDMAYGRRNNDTNDLLKISYSKDCGQTWQVRASWDTDELVTVGTGNVGNNFTPNNTEWLEKSVNIQSAAEQNDVIIRFEFSGDRGSYLYIDNVRLTGEWLSILESDNFPKKKILKKVDILGRNVINSRLSFEIYENGQVIKIYEFE